MKSLKVSVVMAVNNGMPYLKEAAQSILNQTYKNFEFIIIDDASTDETWSYLASIKDDRVKLIKNTKNLGLAASLNIGLKIAKGEYIARMDADDISAVDRFQKQVNFLNTHEDYILVGSQVQCINENNNPVSGFDVPLEDHQIKKKLFWKNPINHPSVMFRRLNVLKIGAYRIFFNGIEDYDLWFRIARIGKIANLPERLVKRRIYQNALTQKNHLKTELLALLIRIINLPNYDYLLGFLFFISYRYFFTWLLWHGRGVPPLSDNSYFYLSSANNIFNLQNFEQFRLVLFSALLRLLGLITGGNLESAFKLNFYLGPLVMFGALAFFLSKLETNKNIRLLLFIVLSLYSGSGAYHGFFWIVSSFYQLALFFVILGFLVSKQKVNAIIIYTIILLFIFSHPTSIFAASIFFVYFFLRLISRKVDKHFLNNSKNIFTSLAVSFLAYYLLGRLFPAGDSPESFQTSTELVKNLVSGNIKPISFSIIWQEYFSIFFFNHVSVLFYALMFCFVAYVKQKNILAIFLAAFSFVFIGAFVPYGARTLGYLWPISFIVIGYSIVGIFLFLKNLNSILSYLSVFPVIFLIILASVFNLISVKTLNLRKDYHWDRSCPGKLSGNIFFTNLESLYAFNLYGDNLSSEYLLTEKNMSLFLNPGSFFVITNDTDYKEERLSKLEQSITNLITRRNNSVQVVYPTNSWTIRSADRQMTKEKLKDNSLSLDFAYDCGKYTAYKVKKI